MTFACRGSSLLVVGAQIGEIGKGVLRSWEKSCSSNGIPIGGERERADGLRIAGSSLRSRSLGGGVRGGLLSFVGTGDIKGVGEPAGALKKSWSILILSLILGE